MSHLNSFQNDLIKHIRTGSPCLWVQTTEQLHLDKLLPDCANELSCRLREWNLAFGWVQFNNKQPLESNQVSSLAVALSGLRDEDLDGRLIVIKDAQRAFEHDEKAVSHVQQLLQRIQRQHKGRAAVILVGEYLDLPRDFAGQTPKLQLPLPSRDEIFRLLDELSEQHQLRIEEEIRTPVCNACAGLTRQQIDKVVLMACGQDKTVGDDALQRVLREKEKIIADGGVLEMIEATETVNDIGGLENLKKWLTERSHLISRISEAEAVGISLPKGVLIVGMPGCGKSLAAKVAASLFRVPLLRLDIGTLLGKYVGESEHNMRCALAFAETMSPCILWIDELEKAFAGMGSDNDSGVTTRLSGFFLTWLQEKTATTFVVATANDISRLPPELLRKGRFDEIFYVGFPSTFERRDILRIHLDRAKKDLKHFDLGHLATRCRNFTGADIHAAVNAAIESAFLNNEALKQVHLEAAIDSTVPLRDTMRDKVSLYEAKFEELKLRPASRDNGSEGSEPNGRIVSSGWANLISYFFS